MTIINYFNQFWKEFRKRNLSPNDTLLYFYLLDVWNTTGRKKYFECNTKEIELILKMNKMTLTRCRDVLRKRGLIQYVKGDGKLKIPLYSISDVTDNVTDNVTTHRDIELKEKESISKDIPKKEKENRINWDEFKNTFNESLLPSIPRILDLKESRRKKVKLIINEYGEEAILKAYQKINESDFLSGHSSNPNRSWKCNFDFIFNPKNFQKILEGNYDNGEQLQRNTSASITSKQEANDYALQQFLDYRRSREEGMVTEMGKPF